MALKTSCALNSAIIRAFQNQYLKVTSPKNFGLFENVKTYVNKTKKLTNPRYHKEAKNLLCKLWSEGESSGSPQKFLVKLSKFEYKKRLLALETGSRNRDHIAHSASVFLLGLVLIDNCNVIRDAFKDWSAEKFLSKKDCIEFWMWCSTLHDLGYPVEIDNRKNKRKKTIKSKSRFIDLNQWNNLKNFFNLNFNNNIMEIKLRNELLTKREKRHGLASAAIALGFFYGNRFSSTSDLIVDKELEYIIMAIAFHDKGNGETFSKKVKLKEHPLLYLIILCDELQCWNRPSKMTFPFIRSNEVTIGIDRIGEREKIEINIKSQHNTEKKREMLEYACNTLIGKLDMSQLQLEININGQSILLN